MAALDSHELVEQLRDAIADVPGVRLAFLFGSRARGRGRGDSDVDIGVLVEEELVRADRGRLVRRLAGRLGRVVSSTLLDIVVLNDAPALLRQRVLRDGVLLFARTPEERVRFAVAAIREYQDGDVRRREFTRQRVRRLSDGRDHGGPGDLLAKARGVARLLGKAARVS